MYDADPNFTKILQTDPIFDFSLKNNFKIIIS